MDLKTTINKLESLLLIKSYIKEGRPFNLEETLTEAHKFYNRLYWKRTDLFDIIPEVKHLERIDTLKALLEQLDLTDYDYMVAKTYENLILPLFNSIENNGLYTK